MWLYSVRMEGTTNKIYHQGNLTFIVTPTKVLVKTHLQMFYLEPKLKYWNRRLSLIRAMIELEEIRNLNELASFCANGGITWNVTTSSCYVDKLQPVV